MADIVPVTDNSFDAEVTDSKGNCYMRLNGYRTKALPSAIPTEKLKALQAAMSLDIVAA